MVTTAHQKPSGIDLNWDFGEPASAKYTVLENSTTPAGQKFFQFFVFCVFFELDIFFFLSSLVWFCLNPSNFSFIYLSRLTDQKLWIDRKKVEKTIYIYQWFYMSISLIIEQSTCPSMYLSINRPVKRYLHLYGNLFSYPSIFYMYIPLYI